ncbi:MAG: alpha/beta hydrolase domain-containing protein, partial [Solirubrobacterales bacterium]
LGSSTPFSEEQLSSLYTDFADYLGKYDVAADAMLPDGFILPEDVERLKESARQFAEIRPTAPLLVGNAKNKGNFGLTWVGTEAPDTTFEVQRAAAGKDNWVNVSPTIDGATANFNKEAEGTHKYRLRNTTILPGTNISEPRTVVTPYSEEFGEVKVDRSGPKKPKVKIKGKKFKRNGKKVKNTYRGKVRVKVIGRPDVKLPDGSAGVGLKNKSVPKKKVIKKRGKTVLKIKTRDKLGNKSKPVKVVIKIKKR